ncbi:MAG: DUF362 domain-containing protein [Candidatus Bathyarchaeia archaeon]
MKFWGSLSSKMVEKISPLYVRLCELCCNPFTMGLLSLLWFILRTGTKPSRITYPCQRAALANIYVWLATYIYPILHLFYWRFSKKTKTNLKRLIPIITLAIVGVGVSLTLWGIYENVRREGVREAGLKIEAKLAKFEPSSSIFVVNGTRGNDDGVFKLIELMGKCGLPFYKSPEPGVNKGPSGLIARDDVVIVKVNSQWDERGGTNTDLVKAIIQAILSHPEGFIGEIVVADNGQAQYGSSGRGGSLAWSRNNAENISQSIQSVVDFFAGRGYRVSTYLWDSITTRRVNEYFEGDMDDGYVVNATRNPRTGIMVSYPKFKTAFGTYISFKYGVWDPANQTYSGGKLKVINLPVLKTHSIYGVTACVKHYMGVVSDKLTAMLGARAHDSVGTGGMGTQMVETRFPTLNIIDAIWVNAVPRGGPSTSYNEATRVNIIAASLDPVALDYWATKYILLEVARRKGYSGLSSIDPDNTERGSFGYWLRLSMEEIRRAGYQATVDEDYMSIYVISLS